MSFATAIKKGMTAVHSAYSQQRKAAEERAEHRMQSAKTRYEKERIKAELEVEKLKLQRQMYEAQAKVQKEREDVAEARKRAQAGRGGVTSFLSTTARSFKQLQKDLQGKPARRPARKKATVTRKKTTARRKR